jgi:N-acetylmuramoyl-L-alanine amidase
VQRGRFVLRFAVLLLLLPTLQRPGVAAEEEDQGPPILSSGTATVIIEGNRLTVPYDLSAIGPLIALQPLVPWLGGQLEIGPLEQRHGLELGGVEALFGPGAPALTFGPEVRPLSQPPRTGMGGLHVPIDLLELVYGETKGYEFSWQSDTATLVAGRRVARDIAVRPEIVHLQGVTTVVLTFGEKPRYRLHEEPGSIEIEMVGDRLRPVNPARVPAGALIEGLDIREQSILIHPVADVVSQSYELENPFRVVFDLFRGSARAAARPDTATPAAPRPPPRITARPGIHTIVIDPGHGGDNSGAISRSGVLEKEITLPIAAELKAALERAMPVRVLMTRDGDDSLDLDSRSAIANQHKADLFISLHVNSSYGRSAHGAETFFLSLQASDEMAAEIAAIENQGNGAPAADPLNDLDMILWDLAQSHHLSESQRFARLIQEELNGALSLTDRGVKQAPFRVLRGAAMPAVLVELGFLSNPEEERKLQDPVYRTQLVDALVRATKRYRALAPGSSEASRR